MEVVHLGNGLGLGKGSAVDTYDVVIVGSGFGALAAAKSLGKAGVTFSLISSTTEHLFQPLLYQAATGMLSTGEIAPPIRRILAQYDSADVRLGRVVDVDPDDVVTERRHRRRMHSAEVAAPDHRDLHQALPIEAQCGVLPTRLVGA